MKKIVPFVKDIKFNTKIFEITSISLEHNLTIEENNIVSGEFIISGEYKITDSSLNSEPFIYGIPFDITLDTKYDTDRIKIDIDDFKYEILNEEILRVNIDVLIEGVELVELPKEKDISEEIKPDLVIESRNSSKEIKEENNDEREELDVNQEENNERINIFEKIVEEDKNKMNDNSSNLFKEVDEEIKAVDMTDTKNDFNYDNFNSIFSGFDEKSEKYVSYYVHIVRESETVDSICMKYSINLDKLKEYNDIEKITLGSKVIIPYTINETV